MQTRHATLPIRESSGYSDCLDRISARGGETRPLATYRLQFNRNFRFEEARQLVGYMHALGVSHCYASPILKARAFFFQAEDGIRDIGVTGVQTCALPI